MRHSILPDGTFWGWVEVRGWEPRALTEDERSCVNGQIAFYQNEMLAAGAPKDIAVRITALLGHWREHDGLSDGERTMIAADWMTIIGRYPLWAVCDAAEEWLTCERFRPAVADIRKLCDEAVREDRLMLRLLRKVAAAAGRTALDQHTQRPEPAAAAAGTGDHSLMATGEPF